MVVPSNIWSLVTVIVRIGVAVHTDRVIGGIQHSDIMPLATVCLWPVQLARLIALCVSSPLDPPPWSLPCASPSHLSRLDRMPQGKESTPSSLFTTVLHLSHVWRILIARFTSQGVGIGLLCQRRSANCALRCTMAPHSSYPCMCACHRPSCLLQTAGQVGCALCVHPHYSGQRTH